MKENACGSRHGSKDKVVQSCDWDKGCGKSEWLVVGNHNNKKIF